MHGGAHSTVEEEKRKEHSRGLAEDSGPESGQKSTKAIRKKNEKRMVTYCENRSGKRV